MTTDEKYIRRCIELASNGLCNAAPNPMVGAVIVHNGKIIGEGYHARCGEGHAEVNAIRSVKDESLLKESTIYVSLEPCSHYGKTPPCADLIISKGIPRVVVGCIDPFSQVSGRGIKKLRDAGIEVTVGVLEDECKNLIRRFVTFNTRKRPYITLKWAESADGFIDIIRENGSPVVLSTPITSMYVQRSQSIKISHRPYSLAAFRSQTVRPHHTDAGIHRKGKSRRRKSGIHNIRFLKGHITTNTYNPLRKKNTVSACRRRHYPTPVIHQFRSVG